MRRARRTRRSTRRSSSEYRDQIDERDVTPDDFGRIAAQTAKQVILQRIREAERDMMFEEYRDRVGELITGIVQQSDSRYTLVQLRERVEALLPKSEQVDGERYDHSQRIKAVIKEVSPSTKGPSIIVSRRDPELIKKLFELEVPGDRRRPRRDRQRRPRARLPLEDRGRLARRRRRPGRRLRRPARLARAHGRLRAARREDRHHPLQRRARPLRRQGAVARARARGARRRRGQAGDRHRARRPALAGDRPRGPERAPGRAPDRLAHRHPLRDRVRRRGGTSAATSEEEVSAAAARRSSSTGRRCPNASLPGSRYCGLRPAPGAASASTRRYVLAMAGAHATRRSRPLASDAPDADVADIVARLPSEADGDHGAGRGRRGRGRGGSEAADGGQDGTDAPDGLEPDARGRCGRRRARPGRGADRRAARRRRARRARPGGAALASRERRCVGCGARAPKAELRRLARARATASSPTPPARCPGAAHTSAAPPARAAALDAPRARARLPAQRSDVAPDLVESLN